MSAQGTIGYVILFILPIIVWVLTAGHLSDTFIGMTNAQLSTIGSQDSATTQYWLSLIINAFPILWALFIGYNYLNNAARESSGEA